MTKQQKIVKKKNFFRDLGPAALMGFTLFRYLMGYRKCSRCKHYGRCQAVVGWGWCMHDDAFTPGMAARPARKASRWRRCDLFDPRID